ncbi:MAG TPA: glycosyltransferase family 4 protein [Syntrophomonadaceae bacterium]|nr:glycosyltransferase family 4 protein [Syntrophomonadaceae bacterium]HRX21819.1 glycosyltransferase family 4 protein [Syntrophomonadaceae bacterium]
MKALMFSWEYPPNMVGGLGQHVYDLSRFLARKGLTVHLITPRVKGTPDYEKDSGVYIHRVGSPAGDEGNFKSWTFTFNSEAIREAVRINASIGGFDLVHAHDWLVAYAGRAVTKIFELPLVTTIHATEHGRNLGLHNRMQNEINEIEKNLALEAERIICCSSYMKDEICSLFGPFTNDVTVIPNGVEQEQFMKLPGKPKLKIAADDKVVFFIGRLVPEKGLWQLIKAFPQVLYQVPDAKLVIGGKGPIKSTLEKAALELGINNRIIYTGFIKEETRNYLYHRAQVAVFPSLYEPFGIVALEAMATNTPVIVSDVGGLSEIVQDGVNGIKVKPGSIDELADAIIKVLTDENLAARLKKNGTQTIESIYSWDVIADSTINVYHQVLKKSRRHLTNKEDV